LNCQRGPSAEKARLTITVLFRFIPDLKPVPVFDTCKTASVELILSANAGSRLLTQQFLQQRIVKLGANLFDELGFIVGPGAVSEQRNGEVVFGVDPQRGSCVSEVTERMSGKVFAGLRRLRWGIPS
jgi:hypothetical protein